MALRQFAFTARNPETTTLERAFDFAFVARNPRADELERAEATALQLGRDGVYIIVNPANPLAMLARQDLKKILTGEFNNWSDVATPLRPHPTLGLLEGVAQVPAGSTQYRVVVDTQWIADPYNPLVAPNPFGGANSILFVPEFDTALTAPAAAMPTGGQS